MDTKIEIRSGRVLTISIYEHSTSKTTAFLIHGLGGRADQWSEQIQLLKDKYTLIVPQLLGHGESEKPNPWFSNPYTFTELDNDIHAVFDRYQSENNIVLGHSYGGALAVSVAFDHQDKVSKLVLIDPTTCETKSVMPNIYRLPAFVLEWLRPQLDKAFQKLAFDDSANPALVAAESEAGKNNKMYVIKDIIAGMKSIRQVDVSHLNIPTLVIIGETDKIIPPDSIRRFYQAIPRHEFVTIPRAGHMPMLEQPAMVNQAITQFLSE